MFDPVVFCSIVYCLVVGKLADCQYHNIYGHNVGRLRALQISQSNYYQLDFGAGFLERSLEFGDGFVHSEIVIPGPLIVLTQFLG
jgi:hypothetical protein